MGRPIVYCASCGKSLQEHEFEKRLASIIDDRPYCAVCRTPPAPEGEKSTPARLSPPSQRKIATARIPVSPSTARRVGKPASKVPLFAGLAAGGVALVILLVAAFSSPSRPPPPPVEREPTAKPTAVPAPAPGSRPPAPKDPAASADIERSMREEAERQKARKLDEFLASIRKLAEEDRNLLRGAEIENMLNSAAAMAGARRAEVHSLRVEVRKRIEENRVRLTFVAHWKLDEKAGVAAADSAGSHAGALEKGPAWTDGRLGGALSFDGTDDGVRVENSERLSPQAGPEGEMTLAAWIKIPERPPASDQGRTPIVCKGDLRAFEYALYVNADGRAGFALWTLGGEGHAELAGGSIAVGRWHHVAGVFKKGRFARLLLDGVQVSELTTFKGELAAGHSDLFLGRRGDKQFLKGAVDDVRLYSRVLSDAELKALAEGKE